MGRFDRSRSGSEDPVFDGFGVFDFLAEARAAELLNAAVGHRDVTLIFVEFGGPGIAWSVG